MPKAYSKGALASILAPKGNSPQSSSSLSGRKRSRVETSDAAVPVNAPADALSAAFAHAPSAAARANSRHGSDGVAAVTTAASMALAATGPHCAIGLHRILRERGAREGQK